MKRVFRLALAGVLLLAAVLTVAAYSVPADIHAHASVVIARPPAVVWAFLNDHTNEPRWFPEYTTVTPLPDKRWKAFGKDGSTSLFEEVSSNPPHQFVTRMVESTHPLTGEWKVDVAAVDGGTRVTTAATVRFQSRFLRLVGHVLSADKEEEKTLLLLKRALER